MPARLIYTLCKKKKKSGASIIGTYVQLNPYIADTIGNLHNQAVEHNVAAFSELSLAVHWWGRLSTG